MQLNNVLKVLTFTLRPHHPNKNHMVCDICCICFVFKINLKDLFDKIKTGYICWHIMLQRNSVPYPWQSSNKGFNQTKKALVHKQKGC